MNKIIAILFLIAATLTMAAQPALAGGDKVQGDLGQGDVEQWGPSPFGDPSETSPGPLN